MKTLTQDIFNELFIRYPQLTTCKSDIEKAFELLYKTYESKGKVLCCGNGGSASDSEHIVGELLKSFKMKRAVDESFASTLALYDGGKELVEKLEGALPAISLVSQTSIISAFANDRSWETAFAQQVYGLGNKNDCLISLSTSGNSKNCVYATMVAKAKFMNTIAFTGAKGGKLREICDVTIAVPETETFKIQELHLPVYHCLCAMLESEFFA
ncbi:MAG: SIS domain-containing protein [Clostridia bacterium]|nr:SIS domain-containing protein [Clostridia bacterium]